MRSPGARIGNPPNLEKTLGSIHSVRFWNIPASQEDKPEKSSRGQIVSACYRDGRLWVQALFGQMPTVSSAGFYGVDLKTFSTQQVEYHGEGYSFTLEMARGMVMRNRREFDVDSNYLYLCMKDSVGRYSFQKQTWEQFSPAGDGKPQRLGQRLFFTSSNSILECLPDGTLQLVASCRRRPALNALDYLDDYASCHLFVDGKGRLNVYAGHELYALSGTNDWKRYASLPMRDDAAAQLFDDGFITENHDWWGMFGPCLKPELLFRTPTQPSPRYAPPAKTQAPRWPAPPPAREACLDGDCVWFLVDSSRPIPGAPGSSQAEDLSLVRFKYDETNAVRIALDLSQPQSAAGPRQWTLATTPEGFIATQTAVPGFWFIPRDELNRAVAEANQPARH